RRRSTCCDIPPVDDVLLTVSVKLFRAPALRIDDLSSLKRLVDVIHDLNAATFGSSNNPRVFNQPFVELVTIRIGNYDVVTHLRRGKRKTIWHGHGQRLGMPGPG